MTRESPGWELPPSNLPRAMSNEIRLPLQTNCFYHDYLIILEMGVIIERKVRFW